MSRLYTLVINVLNFVKLGMKDMTLMCCVSCHCYQQNKYSDRANLVGGKGAGAMQAK
jgi:hypothetical protein